MTIIELCPSSVYCSTTDRTELLEVILFIQKNYPKMETRHQMAVTIFESREPEPPRHIDEPPKGKDKVE